ncbi:MAG: putative lipid II flippase FtsW [Nitrosomonadales bacterium]|jgi:cell division protein FtsW|nr:putative lipid II flippase FtsW [Nitrosomonadales bacterium]MBT6014544.1 putative lipid II flippase FtsW [Nitrosomonadales bacterium]MBT6251270.1 putative lipid II flippase FtsW [Nitrosomonadales bacterium]MBT6818189.1 putative lipid II flippase FtsW [Nitrosomonadales bacterium]MBT7120813.1 putative lipid II flippase FtsW [Nitrosomonadales bacterium]
MKIFSAQTNYNLPIYDYNLVWAALLLLGSGLVMVYSSSVDIAASSKALNFNSYHYLMRQSIYILIGFILGYVAFLVPIYFWQKIAPILFIFGLILLVLVLIPGIGKEVNGSKRWISLIIINFQPSELVKLFTVMYASDYVLRKSKQMRTIVKGFLPMLGIIVLTGFLLLLEPDFGAFTVITVIAMGLLFLGGLTYKIFFSLLFFAPVIIYYLIKLEPYRFERIIGFLDPWDDPLGNSYQLTHSLMAFGRGEFFGSGLGASVEKLQYLPEAHTDFILAVIGEEFGLLGVSIIIILFAFLVVRMFGIAKESIQNKKPFSALMAQGIGLWFGIQGIINMGVNLGLFPTKGLTLPLLSYGGTGILMNMIAIAIVLKIDFENRRNMRGQFY